MEDSEFIKRTRKSLNHRFLRIPTKRFFLDASVYRRLESIEAFSARVGIWHCIDIFCFYFNWSVKCTIEQLDLFDFFTMRSKYAVQDDKSISAPLQVAFRMPNKLNFHSTLCSGRQMKYCNWIEIKFIRQGKRLKMSRNWFTILTSVVKSFWFDCSL